MNNRISSWTKVLHLALRPTLCLVLAFTLLPHVTYSQTTQSQVNQLDISIARVKSGSILNADIERVVGAGAAQAVLPSLEEQFGRTTDIAQLDIIASALVRLGDKDEAYWKFLLDQASLAIGSDLPDPFHDSQWDTAHRQLSPELNAWAHTHNVDYSTAAQSAVYELPQKVLLLGVTGDQRAIPLLRRGLQARNPIIAMMAAQGLAKIQDKDSIPLIIDACRKAPKGFANGIAGASLIFFDDPRAQSAVDSYVPKEQAKAFRDARAHGLKPFGE